MPDPLVSVITATYNRSEVLKLALESALRQTVRDIEVVVVGDGCTDDTAEVVRALGDDRLRWHNRAKNAGEQSAANNDGVALARGRFLAFLNHDDLWWPDHLEQCLDALERQAADLAFGFGAYVMPGGGLLPIAPAVTGFYERHLIVPASTWVHRRELWEQVGPWRPARQLLLSPSQDWLLRAHRAGGRLVQSRALSTLLIQSGLRPGSYRERRGADEHQGWHRSLRDDPAALRLHVVGEIAHEQAALLAAPRTLRFGVARVAKDVVRRMVIAGGWTPMHLDHALRYRRRGAFLSHVRRVRGLE